MPEDIDVRQHIDAPPSKVWALLDDSSSWPNWTSIDAFELERAPESPGATGEIRRFKTGPITVREEIVERTPEQRLSYRLLGGLPVKDYVAVIDLEPDEDGTDVRWHTTFSGKAPATGWFFRLMLGKATRDFVKGLARASADV
jgi:uncharacterized protein YndB with AHSA1/START domain